MNQRLVRFILRYAAFALLPALLFAQPTGALKVTMLNVGQADASLVEVTFIRS